MGIKSAKNTNNVNQSNANESDDENFTTSKITLVLIDYFERGGLIFPSYEIFNILFSIDQYLSVFFILKLEKNLIMNQYLILTLGVMIMNNLIFYVKILCLIFLN